MSASLSTEAAMASICEDISNLPQDLRFKVEGFITNEREEKEKFQLAFETLQIEKGISSRTRKACCFAYVIGKSVMRPWPKLIEGGGRVPIAGDMAVSPVAGLLCCLVIYCKAQEGVSFLCSI